MKTQSAFWFIGTLAAGTAGGLAIKRLRLPAGAMLGAMLGAALLQLLVGHAYFPPQIRVALQIASGAMIGCRITRRDLYALKTLAAPLGLLIAGLLTVNLGIGFLIHKSSNIDLATALFAATPGGLTDITLIADELGANAAQVSVLQLTRMLSIVTILPTLFKGMGTHPAKDYAPAPPSGIAGYLAACPQWARFLLTLAVAAAGGLAAMLLHIPAGAMVGAMLATTALNIASAQATFPDSGRMGLQLCAGAYIGVQMNRMFFLSLGTLIVPVLLILLGVGLTTLTVGYAMHRLCGMDRLTSLLASAPGGLQEMSLLAEDLGCDVPRVVILQTLRLFAVILLFPTLLTWVIGWMG